MTADHTLPSPASGGGLSEAENVIPLDRLADQFEQWAKNNAAAAKRIKDTDPDNEFDARAEAFTDAAVWLRRALAATRTDAAAGWADTPVNIGAPTDELTLRQLAYDHYHGHGLIDASSCADLYVDALARRRLSALSSAAVEAGGEGLREAATDLFVTLDAIVPALRVLHTMAANAGLKPAQTKAAEMLGWVTAACAKASHALTAAALTSPQPAKDPGAAGVGLTAEALLAGAEELALVSGRYVGVDSTDGSKHPLLAHASKDFAAAYAAAQRHPAPGRGGEAGDAALREAASKKLRPLLMRARSIHTHPRDKRQTEFDIIVSEAVEAALALPDAPPRAEPYKAGAAAENDYGSAETVTSPPAPVAQAEEALGAEELDWYETWAEGGDALSGPLLLRLIAAVRASRVAGAEGVLRWLDFDDWSDGASYPDRTLAEAFEAGRERAAIAPPRRSGHGGGGVSASVRRPGSPGGDRAACHLAIEVACGGFKVADALAAMVDCFGNMIAFAAEDREHANRLAVEFLPDILSSIEEGWTDARAARGNPLARTPAADRAKHEGETHGPA